MQALSVAIGPSGVRLFAERLVAHELAAAFRTMKAPDKEITVPTFHDTTGGAVTYYENTKIRLNEGAFRNFSPVFQQIAQEANGEFPLVVKSSNFQAAYKWNETWHETNCYDGDCIDRDRKGGPWDYIPGVGSMTSSLRLAFVFNPRTKSYDIKVLNSKGVPSGANANIPGQSVIMNTDRGCFSAKLEEATVSALASVDFNAALAASIPALLKSIPASGQLKADIKYDFGLGESGMVFPADHNGIQIGVTGGVHYKTEAYPKPAPAAVPVPPAPVSHHMCVYVSDYEINALHWAYFKAGLLKVTVTPSEVPNPDVLKVKTYVSAIPALKPYATYAMNAEAEPQKEPEASFQEVYEFTDTSMKQLLAKLPADAYQKILGMEGNNYVVWKDVEDDLTLAEIPAQYFTAIKDIVKSMGRVARQDVKFTMKVMNGAPQLPNVVFTLTRADILANLKMGESGSAQTMQYSFLAAKTTARFVSSTIPGFPSGDSFATLIWPVVGETAYIKLLQQMGSTGVPIPIMADFQFLFREAQLSIQTGFVSILANLGFKGSRR